MFVQLQHRQSRVTSRHGDAKQLQQVRLHLQAIQIETPIQRQHRLSLHCVSDIQTEPIPSQHHLLQRAVRVQPTDRVIPNHQSIQPMVEYLTQVKY